MNKDQEKDILIADDNFDNARVIGELSQSAGIGPARIRIVGSVEEAIQAIKTHQPSLTITNMMFLGEEGGLRLLEQVDEDGKPFIKGPVIVASGNSEPSLKQRCFASPAKVVAYWVKPYDITRENISTQVANYLSNPFEP